MKNKTKNEIIHHKSIKISSNTTNIVIYLIKSEIEFQNHTSPSTSISILYITHLSLTGENNAPALSPPGIATSGTRISLRFIICFNKRMGSVENRKPLH